MGCIQKEESSAELSRHAPKEAKSKRDTKNWLELSKSLQCLATYLDEVNRNKEGIQYC